MSGPSPSDRPDLYTAISPGARARQRTRRALETLAGESGSGPRAPRVRGPKRSWTRGEWILLPVAAVTAFLLVFLGDGDVGRDDPFKAVGAFTSGFPKEYDEQGWWVTMGRSLAPIVAIWATVRLVMVLYAQRIREWWVRTKRDHTIVVGLGEAGLPAVRRYRREGGTVVAVTQQPFGPGAEEALSLGAYIVSGSGSDPATLHAAGIRRARRILCADANDVVNLQVALEALEASLGSDRRVLEIIVEASEASPATALLGVARSSGRVTLFSMRDLWAWRLLAAGPLWRYRSVGEKAPDLVILGGSELGSALLLCACRWWHFNATEKQSSERLRIIVIDPDAQEVCGRAVARHAELPETVDLRPLAVELAEGFDEIDNALRGDGRQWVVYVCLDVSDSVRRASARGVQQRLAGSTEGVVVVAVSNRSDRVDDLAPPVREIESDDAENDFDPANFDRVEVLARAIHDEYELHMRETGQVSAPALKPFDELPSHLKESNREQARSIDEQLVSILKLPAPLRHWSRVRELASEDIEVLSELEHVRWCLEKLATGWTYGPKRDNDRRHHPDLVPWGALSHDSREISRTFMRRRPWTLARVGEAIVRHPVRDHLARLTHETYREHALPSAPPWNELPERERAASGAFVDDIPVKLLHVGHRITSVPDSACSLELTEAEIELLARHEHERWAAFHTGEGLAHSGGRPAGDPDLVPWDELPDHRKEIDRVLVRAIPALLVEVGLSVERVDGSFLEHGLRACEAPVHEGG